jgi:hypothetical protein
VSIEYILVSVEYIPYKRTRVRAPDPASPFLCGWSPANGKRPCLGVGSPSRTHRTSLGRVRHSHRCDVVIAAAPVSRGGPCAVPLHAAAGPPRDPKPEEGAPRGGRLAPPASGTKRVCGVCGVCVCECVRGPHVRGKPSHGRSESRTSISRSKCGLLRAPMSRCAAARTPEAPPHAPPPPPLPLPPPRPPTTPPPLALSLTQGRAAGGRSWLAACGSTCSLPWLALALELLRCG